MQKLYWLDEIESSERFLVGEKAFALSQLRQQGYPVQPGFVLDGDSFRVFLENLSLSASWLADFPDSFLHLDLNNYKTLQFLAQQSRQTMRETQIDSQLLTTLVEAAQSFKATHLIFRISVASPALANINLGGLLPAQISESVPKAIELALKQAWTSLFSAKSLFYWNRLNLGLEQLNIAILVQPMRQVIASGIAEIEADLLRLQSTWGLGYSLLYGEVLPDIYEIELAKGIIKSQNLGNKSRAYRLKIQTQSEDCLEVYSLSQAEQENYSLDQVSLEQFLPILQHLSREKNDRISLEWILTTASESEPSQVYITQLLPNLKPSISRREKISQNPILPNLIFEKDKSQIQNQMKEKKTQIELRGIGASSGIVIADTHVISDRDSPAAVIAVGKILIMKQLTPDWLPWLKQAKGIITEQGGMTSHGAILARELGIPAIVGVRKATALLTTGASILMDGDKGEIHQLSADWESKNSSLPIPNSQALISQDVIGTQLMVNLSQTSLIPTVVALPVNGVGLLRSELMLVDLFREKPLEKWLKTEEKSDFITSLTQLIQEFAIAFTPRPIFYRSLDWKNPQKENIFSQQRGTSGYRLDSTLFDLELEALLAIQQAGYTNVNLILPFVRSVEEFSFCYQRVEKIGLTQISTFQLWIMAEVPSVIFLLSEYVKAGVQGIAIGSNDLAQLLLGIEREESHFSTNWYSYHPALLLAIKQLIKQAKTYNIPCSICGQLPVQYPQVIEHLVRWGITTISVEPEAVLRTYQAIAQAEKRLILEGSRQQLNLF